MEAKQVIVMRTDLGMRKGKMIAQGAHASMKWLVESITPHPMELSESQRAWINGLFTKICVRVDSEEKLLEVHQRAQDAGLVSYLIEDAGRTEFHGERTYTCCAIGPEWTENIDPVTGHLQLL